MDQGRAHRGPGTGKLGLCRDWLPWTRDGRTLDQGQAHRGPGQAHLDLKRPTLSSDGPTWAKFGLSEAHLLADAKVAAT